MPGSRLRELLSRLRALFRRSALDEEFNNEVAAHMSLLAERFERQGMTANEARYAARRQFGGITQMREELRESRGFPLFETILQDARYISRQLRKSPVFTASAVLTLALGIGANTAIFSLVDQLILRLLPIKNPQQVVELVGEGHYYGSNYGHNMLSYPMYEDIRDRQPVFSLMMCRRAEGFTIGLSSSRSEVASGELVSGNYFAMLGLHPAIGRLFTANDDLHQNANPLAVLSYAYWKNRFGGNRDALGRTIRVNNHPMTIVGVVQPGFHGLEPGLPTEVFVPITMTPTLCPDQDFANMYDRRQRWVNAYGRLKPGLTMQTAKAGLQPLFHQIIDMEVLQPAFRNVSAYDKAQFLKMWLNVVPGSQGNTILRRTFEKPLWVLMGVVGLVLMIACANLASLITARASGRQREISVRLALGASRFRMMRQLLTESFMLAAVGGIAGVGVAVVLVKGLLAFLPANIGGYVISSSPDLRILSFSLGIALSTGVLFGLAPAVQATRLDIVKTLKEQATNFAGGAAQVSFRKVLVSAQVALSLLLLIGAGLFIHSLANLRLLNPGFLTRNVVQVQLSSLYAIGYDQAHAPVFYRLLQQRLRSLPDVRSVGAASKAFLSGNDWENSITVAGYQAKPGEDIDSYMNAVSPDYFETLGIHLLAGRDFTHGDGDKVAIVNECFARHYFGKKSALGHYIGRGSDPGTPANIQIIGVVNDTHYRSLQEKLSRQVYLVANQHYLDGGTVYVNTGKDPKSIFGSIRSIVHNIEPRLPVLSIKTVDQQLNESLITERLIATLSTGFSILATLLAVIGLYGVMSYTVARRAREIAIRMALGALKGNVIWLVMREVLLLVAAGITVAIPVALALAHFVQAELYGIQPTDPLSIVFATLLLAAVALLAGYIPARRAASYDPIRVLRYE